MSQGTSARAALLTVLPVVALVGAGLWLWLAEPSRRGTPSATEGRPLPVVDRPLSRPSLGADTSLRPTTPPANPIDVSETVLMPDGKRLRSLNRVRNPPAIQWPRDVPYSPVTGTKLDARGFEWYVHADGSVSTVFMLYRSDLGREDPTAVVHNPATPLPMDAGDVPKK